MYGKRKAFPYFLTKISILANIWVHDVTCEVALKTLKFYLKTLFFAKIKYVIDEHSDVTILFWNLFQRLKHFSSIKCESLKNFMSFSFVFPWFWASIPSDFFKLFQFFIWMDRVILVIGTVDRRSRCCVAWNIRIILILYIFILMQFHSWSVWFSFQ